MCPIYNGKVWFTGLWVVLVGAMLVCDSAATAPSDPPTATAVPAPTATVAPAATAAPVHTSAGLAKVGISDATIDPERRSPKETLTVGLHYAHSPMWLDPQVYNSPVFNHFIYIVHDTVIKPMAGNVWTYSLAEYAEMPTDYTYAKFRLREGLKFHDGTPL